MIKKQIPGFLLLTAGLTLVDLSVHQSVILYFVIASLLIAHTIERERLFHPMQFVVLAYLIGYPVAAIAFEVLPPEPGALRIAEAAEQPGMLWALRGFAAMSIGYALVRSRPRRLSAWAPPRTEREPSRLAIRLVGLTGMAGVMGSLLNIVFFGLSLTFIEQQRGAADSVQGSFALVLDLLSSMVEPFLAGYVILRRNKVRRAWLDGLAILLAVITSAQIVSAGSKAAIIEPVLAVTTGYLLAGARMRPRQILLLLSATIAVYFSFSVVTEYRSLMHGANFSGRDVFSFSTQAEIFGKAVVASVSLTGAESERETEMGAREVSHRLGAPLFGLSNLLYATGFHSPMENAWESFLLPFYAVLPRAAVEKPIFFDSAINASHYYGWAYGGISLSMVGSFYYAWGYVGIIIGMAGLGGLLAAVFRRAAGGEIANMHSVLLGVAVLILAIQPEMAFQNSAIVLVRVALLFAALRWMSRIAWRPSTLSGGEMLPGAHPNEHKEER